MYEEYVHKPILEFYKKNPTPANERVISKIQIMYYMKILMQNVKSEYNVNL